MKLFFDTETTWLPKSRKEKLSNFENRPRIVEIARILYDNNWKKISENDYIIKPNWFIIPEESSKIHWITTEIANKKWQNIDKVLSYFYNDVKKSNEIIWHNVDFDITITSVELLRLWIKSIFDDKKIFCTMKKNIEFCKLPWRNWYKYPKLSDLYFKIFWKNFENAHNALADTKACADCYFAINNKSKKNIKELKNIKFDKIWEKTLKLMNNSQNNIFITGKAWTWKSTLLKYFIENSDKNIVVLAPTWISALNIWWTTIHSFFWFWHTITPEIAQKKWKKAKNKKIYKNINSIVIDEISMVRADIFDCIDIFLKEAIWNNNPFGWIQIILIWDCYQLPPVVKQEEKIYFSQVYKSPYFFDSNIFQNQLFKIEIIQLKKIYRQTDETFINILNAIRTKKLEEKHIEILNKNLVWELDIIKNWEIYLTWTNKKVDKINTKQLNILKWTEKNYYANIEWNINIKQFPTKFELILKEKAQIMFLNNDSWKRRVNWTLWEIIELEDEWIYVKLYDEENSEVFVDSHTRDISEYKYNSKSKKLEPKIIWQFTQLPIKLARATTIHKSQWKTFDNVIIDLWKIFSHWQTYVALSRCTNLKWLKLVKPIKNSHIILDRRVLDFMKEN